MSDHLSLRVARIVDRFREEHFRGEPDWSPLEDALPAVWWGGFMWMSRVSQGGTVVELYKHGIARRYLSLDHDGGAWRYDSEENVYRPQPLATAVEAVFEGVELCAADRSTVYDTAYIAARNRRLRDRGWGGGHLRPPGETEADSPRSLDGLSVSRLVSGWPLTNGVLWIRDL